MYSNEILRLRPLQDSDIESLYLLRQDFPAVKSYIGSPFPTNIENEKRFLSEIYQGSLRNNVYFAIEEIENETFVGYCTAKNVNFINRNAEVGIIFCKNGRGRGFFKPVSGLFYSYLFNELNLHKVYSFVLADNEIALENDKKIGFKVEGLIEEQVFQEGKFKGVYFVSLYKDVFMKTKYYTK